MMDVQRVFARIRLVGPDGEVLGVRTISGMGLPDLEAIDEVGQVQLQALRAGASVAFETACPALLELLELSGLSVEMWRQTEDGEGGVGVEKKGH